MLSGPFPNVIRCPLLIGEEVESRTKTMWPELLSAVIKDMTDFGHKPQLPCPDSEIAELRRRARTDLGNELPPEYLALLTRVNGLNWNGLFIYASRPSRMEGRPDLTISGVVEINQAYRRAVCMDDYLVLADWDTDIYAHHIPTNTFLVTSKPSLVVLETYADCGSLLAFALRTALGE